MSSNAKSEKMKLAPIRSVSDFILDSKKYLPPSFSDLKRLNNRTTSNLLYYQTNYFAISTACFLLFLVFQCNRLLTGAFGIVTAAALALFALDKIPQASALRAQYPVAVFGAWALDLVVVYMALRPILFFALVVLVPILFWILHAAMRSRGLKNKVSNKIDQMGGQVYTNTPMGFVLQALGFEPKDFED